MAGWKLPRPWREALRAAVQAPPRRPREPLWWQGHRIGSIEDDLLPRAGLAHLAARADDGWHLQAGELSSSLQAVAVGLRDAGLSNAWRNELLAVRAADGAVLGLIERAAARPLGIATEAVHLLARSEDGGHWLQLRARDKDSDPGLWDTLVGGMVPASDDVQRALERETWEEAGLRPAQLRDLRHGGRAEVARPSSGRLAHGYTVQALDWFTCVLPAGVQPCNQDGEVEEFRCFDDAQVVRLLQAGLCTLDAALLMLRAFGGDPPE